jgi:hypothetical protein
VAELVVVAIQMEQMLAVMEVQVLLYSLTFRQNDLLEAP